MTDPGTDTDALKAEIAETREALAANVEALVAKTDLKATFRRRAADLGRRLTSPIRRKKQPELPQ